MDLGNSNQVDGHRTVPYQPGALLAVWYVVFQARANLNNSLLKLLEISLLFTFSPAIIQI